jgi:hypothetical protein
VWCVQRVKRRANVRLMSAGGSLREVANRPAAERLTQTQVQRIRRRWQAGELLCALADEHGVSSRNLRRRLKTADVAAAAGREQTPAGAEPKRSGRQPTQASTRRERAPTVEELEQAIETDTRVARAFISAIEDDVRRRCEEELTRCRQERVRLLAAAVRSYTEARRLEDRGRLIDSNRVRRLDDGDVLRYFCRPYRPLPDERAGSALTRPLAAAYGQRRLLAAAFDSRLLR